MSKIIITIFTFVLGHAVKGNKIIGIRVCLAASHHPVVYSFLIIAPRSVLFLT